MYIQLLNYEEKEKNYESISNFKPLKKYFSIVQLCVVKRKVFAGNVLRNSAI